MFALLRVCEAKRRLERSWRKEDGVLKMHAQPFTRDDLPRLLDLVAGNAASRPTGQTYLMTSDVAWQFPGCAPKDNIRLWSDSSGLAAYAWFQPPETILFDVRHDIESCSDVFLVVMGWATERRSAFPPGFPFYVNLKSMDEWAEALLNPDPKGVSRSRHLVMSALESDYQRTEMLLQHGFQPTEHFEPILTCDLSTVSIPDDSAEFSVRHVQDSELDARVALHRASWAPASGFDMERYLKVRAMTPTYDPELDIVAVAEDGALASYTIAWKDPVSLIGSFEPFGTRPEYRGTGVSQAVIAEGFRRLGQKGMRHARIYTASFNHPAAKLYKSCGFETVDLSRTFLKSL